MWLLEARYRPSHHFPPNLLDASCLCKRFVVFDISVLSLRCRGVWWPHNFTSPRSTTGLVISVTLSRIEAQGPKGQAKNLCAYRLYMCFWLLAVPTKKKNNNTVCDKTHFCPVTLCPRSSCPPTQTQLLSPAHAGNNANKAGPFSVRNAVNIFWTLTAPEGWC